MDSRAKQRLTGAVILVALFVLLVPELLTGPKDAAQAPAADEEAGLRRYTIDLNAPASPAGQQTAEPAVQLPAVAESPRAAANGPATALAQPGEAARAETAMPAATVDSEPTATASTPPAASQSRSSSAAAPAAVPDSRPAATPPPPRATSPAPAGGTRFVVQLGSFGSRDNAERLVRDMTAKGFTTFIAPTTTNGRALYRVRVGPTKDRASAEALAAQLKRVGQSGAIVPIS